MTTTAERAILYGYWASSCTWRVRAALLWKRVQLEERPVDIVHNKDQLTDQYKVLNPAQKVPALLIDGVTLVESMAIIQYLEDTRPTPPLVPKSPLLKARMREICEVITGIQPLQNVGLKSHFDTDQQYSQFTKYWTRRGLETLEDLLDKSAGTFCVGDQLTQADLCFVPQLYNAVTRHELSITKFPTVSKLYERLLKEEIFVKSHPKNLKPKL